MRKIKFTLNMMYHPDPIRNVMEFDDDATDEEIGRK